MEQQTNYLFARDSENLQLPYDEYVTLVEKAKEVKRMQEVSRSVVADLKHILDGSAPAEPVKVPEAHEEAEKVSVEFSAAAQESAPDAEAQQEPSAEAHQESAPEPEAHQESTPEPEAQQESAPEPEAQQEPTPEPVVDEEPSQDAEPEPENASSEPEADAEASEQAPVANTRGEVVEVPPIKNEIAEHFNQHDDSGRLFNIFKQYYTCLNELCGGTVRVTMKDGFCSLWNYDEWEEFAFVDIFEGQLRIALDPRYTDELKSLSLCEVPRLLSSRRNVICVKVEDLNNTVLDVMAKAFFEVGAQVG